MLGALSSFIAPIAKIAMPILGNVGRTLASAFLTQGTKKISSSLSDRGITIQRQAIPYLVSDMKRGSQIARKKQNQPEKEYVQTYEQQQYQDPQNDTKTKVIRKMQKPAKITNKRFLRRR